MKLEYRAKVKDYGTNTCRSISKSYLLFTLVHNMAIRSHITHGRLFECAGYLLLFALFFSHFLLSLSLIIMGILSIWRYDAASTRLRLNRSFWRASSGIWTIPILGFILIFLLNVLSIYNTEDLGSYMDNLRVKLPYLALPIIFLNHTISQKLYFRFYSFFFWISCLFMAGVMLHYALDYTAITESIRKGQAIPTPINHTKFSILIAIALNAQIILWLQKRSERRLGANWIQGLLMLFLFVSLHVLAVRSGIICFYAAFIITTLIYLVRQRSYYAIIGLGCLVAIGPYLGYTYVPSLQNKVNYTVYDLDMYRQGKGNFYSDSERIKSFVVGSEVWKQNPILGVGIGDVKAECVAIYNQKYQKSKRLVPHNQYLYTGVAFGILGFLIFIGSYGLPLFWNRGYQDPLLLSFFIILSLFCLVERPIERSNFIALHCFFVLCAIRCTAQSDQSLPEQKR